jgi:NADH-quinone oxidoreductase subunit J
MNILFYIAAIIAVFSTAMVITRRNAVHALMFLVVSLISVSVMMYTMGAPYAAVLEIIVYAGAIMILFVFVVMMLNLSVSPDDEKRKTGWKTWIIPIILCLILTVDFAFAFSNNMSANTAIIKVIGPKQVGISLFTTYLLGVELAGMLLLAGIVGAYHLGKTKKTNLHRYLENRTLETEA